MAVATGAPSRAGLGKVIVASLIGTTIEFFDFYIYGIAAAIAIGPIFFPKAAAETQSLNAFLTFGLAFVARPVGSFLFGHFGDRIGRKSTLVATLLVMGLSTALIGFLPGYGSWGLGAPIALCVLRFLQGVGLGGEWGGAALLATESSPAGRRAWFGMFPQLGPSIGFLLANGAFLALTLALSAEDFAAWGWRIPFIASAALVVLGLYVRLNLGETEAFARALARSRPLRLPLATAFSGHWREILQGSFAMAVCYVLFYTSTVFSLGYGVGKLGIPRQTFLELLCVAILFMAAATPISAWLADRFGRRPVLIVGALLAALSGFTMAPLLGSGDLVLVGVFLALELFLMGVTFAPMAALLPELFPTRVRYTGASIAYNVGGILGGSLAPYIAQQLAEAGGLGLVGLYVSGTAVLSLFAVIAMDESRARDLQAV